MRSYPSPGKKRQELAEVLGERIQGFRRERKWTRPYVASILEVKAEWLERDEAGNLLPPTYTIYPLSRLFGVSAGSLLDDEPEERPVTTSTRLVQLVRRLEGLPRSGQE